MRSILLFNQNHSQHTLYMYNANQFEHQTAFAAQLLQQFIDSVFVSVTK